jgi:ketosteroid isomerase-like protein
MSELSQKQQRNVEHARRAFEAFDRGEGELVLEMMDPEIEVYSPPSLVNSGTFLGTDGYMRWLTEWLEAWEEFDAGVQYDAIEPVGERHVVVPVHQTAVGRGSGVPVELDLCFMGQINGERWVALHLYPDVDEAREVAERRESGAN